jgi:hypothetical protein
METRFKTPKKERGLHTKKLKSGYGERQKTEFNMPEKCRKG